LISNSPFEELQPMIRIKLKLSPGVHKSMLHFCSFSHVTGAIRAN
jgi:hypothetical protein